MKRIFHKIEKITDAAIPYALLVLLAVIITELFFHKYFIGYEWVFSLIDGIVVGIFVVDLIFKYIKVKKIPLFVKRYWMDIIVVFPFFLMFRFVEQFLPFTGLLEETQMIAHEGVEMEREGVKVARELKVGRLSRSRKFLRFLRPILRTPRLLKTISIFEKPSHK